MILTRYYKGRLTQLGNRLPLCLVIVAMIANASLALAQDGTGSTTVTIHVVQRGENLFRIAMRYGTTVEAIAQANGIKDVTQISVGQRLLIPNVSPSAANSADAASGSAPGIPVDYVMQPGDSLINLSLRYGMPIAAIARQNRIVNPAQVYVGLSLSLKEGAGSIPPIKTGWLYVVQPDDNLYRVAALYGVSTTRLSEVNKLKRTSLIPGQRLVIPGPDDGPALLDIPQPFSQITMQPAPAEQGRTVALHLTTAAPVKLHGNFMGKALVVFSDSTRQQHTVLYGVDAFARPGIYLLDLTAIDDKGRKSSLSRLIEVIDGGYASETITLPPSQLDLLDPKVTQPEMQQITRVVSNYTAQRFFDGPMGLPCSAPVTSQFGTRRSYNNGPYNQFHTGTDFAGAPGAPIYAPAAGVVVMVASLHVRGNATIIDHGWGIYTGYWHQTEVKVRVGDVVKQGQVIGTVGNTGRVTGPHLHWELFVGGVQVDPLQWARQSFS
jgi:murein DD-endopeptidase MepM/ murein hydrolase activator NlpD